MTTILYAGGEDTSCTVLNANANVGNQCRTAYSRLSFQMQSQVSTFPLSSSLTFPAFTPLGSLWVHGLCGNNNTGSFNNNGIWLAILDGSGIPRIVLRGGTGTGQIKISKVDAAGAFTDLVTSAVGAVPPTSVSNQPNSVDLFINYAVAGQATLFINGVAVADTGAGVDVTTNSVTTLARVVYSTATSANNANWSEMIGLDTSTLGISLWTLAPAASGNTQSWTPNTVGNINETSINDATFVSTTSVNQLSEWTTNITAPSGNFSVLAIAQEARVSRGLTGPQNFEWLLRTADGSDHVTGSVAPTTGSFSNNSGQFWLVNPHTATAWQVSDVTTGFNIGIESLT